MWGKPILWVVHLFWGVLFGFCFKLEGFVVVGVFFFALISVDPRLLVIMVIQMSVKVSHPFLRHM